MRHSAYIDSYRILWLGAQQLSNRSVSYREYWLRLGLSRQAFREDMRALRRAGGNLALYVYLLLLGTLADLHNTGLR